MEEKRKMDGKPILEEPMDVPSVGEQEILEGETKVGSKRRNKEEPVEGKKAELEEGNKGKAEGEKKGGDSGKDSSEKTEAENASGAAHGTESEYPPS